MCVLIIFTITDLFHQFGRGIPDLQRHGQVAAAPYLFERPLDGHIGSIAFGRCGQVDGRLRQDDPAFGHADPVHRIEAGGGQQQGVGVGIADILRCQDDHPAGDEQRVFAPFDHARQPVNGAVGVAAAHRFDEGRYHIIVHLPRFVIDRQLFLDDVERFIVRNNNRIMVDFRIDDQLDGIQELPGIAAGNAQKRFFFLDLYFFLMFLFQVVYGRGQQFQ